MQRSHASVRRSERQHISLPADCRTPWGKIERIGLANISADGCRVIAVNPMLVLGDHVLIRTASLLGAAGTVRWVEEADAGIEFTIPLEEKVLAHLVRNSAAGAMIIVPGRTAPVLLPL